MSDPTPPRTHAPDAPLAPSYGVPVTQPACWYCGKPASPWGPCCIARDRSRLDAIEGPLATGHGVRR